MDQKVVEMVKFSGKKYFFVLPKISPFQRLFWGGMGGGGAKKKFPEQHTGTEATQVSTKLWRPLSQRDLFFIFFQFNKSLDFFFFK